MILSHHRRKRSRRVLTPGQQVAAVIAVDKEAGGWVFRPAVGDTTTGGARWAGASLRRAGIRRVPASTRARPVRSPLEAQMVAVAASISATVYAPPGGADGGLTVWPPPGHCGRRAAAAAGPLRLPGYRRAGESVVTVDAPSQPPLRRRPPRSLAHASLKPAAHQPGSSDSRTAGVRASAVAALGSCSTCSGPQGALLRWTRIAVACFVGDLDGVLGGKHRVKYLLAGTDEGISRLDGCKERF